MPSSSPPFAGHGFLLCGLVVTRLIGWGTTFYSPAVLVRAFERELGLNAEIVFGGITVLLVVGALVAPMIGRRLDSHGTRGTMCLGALVCALGFGVLAGRRGRGAIWRAGW